MGYGLQLLVMGGLRLLYTAGMKVETGELRCNDSVRCAGHFRIHLLETGHKMGDR